MKKLIALILALVLALLCITCLERVRPGSVGVVYSTKGVEAETLSQGWHWVSPIKRVKQFPVSQQQIVFSNDPADYNEKKHEDWSVDALIEAQAEAEANRAIAESITPELIQMKEAEARLKHGWVTVQGAGTVVTNK